MIISSPSSEKTKLLPDSELSGQVFLLSDCATTTHTHTRSSSYRCSSTTVGTLIPSDPNTNECQRLGKMCMFKQPCQFHRTDSSFQAGHTPSSHLSHLIHDNARPPFPLSHWLLRQTAVSAWLESLTGAVRTWDGCGSSPAVQSL